MELAFYQPMEISAQVGEIPWLEFIQPCEHGGGEFFPAVNTN